MGRPKNWPPRPHAHKASGQDRVHVDGRDIYLGPTGSGEARRAYAELVARLAQERGDQPPPDPAPRRGGLAVAELVVLWEAHALERYGESGYERKQYRYALEPLVAAHGDTLVEQFDDRALEDVREEMIKRGWNRPNVNRRVVRIRTVWRWAERRGHAPKGSWANLRTLGPLSAADRRVKQPEPRRGCTFEELDAVCAHAPKAVAAMLYFGWWTGARPGEVRLARAGDFDRSGVIWTFRPRTHKNLWRGHDRVVQVGPQAQAVALPYLEGKGPDDAVFAARGGGHYDRSAYPHAVQRAREAAGVGKIIPYTMRHSARRRIAKECGLETARAVLGQKSIEITNSYDDGPDPALAREAAKRLG